MTDLEEEQAQTNDLEKTNEETMMVLWDWAPTLGLNEDEATEASQVSLVKVTTRSRTLIMDESMSLPKIKKFRENMKKILNTTQTTPKPNPTNIKETITVGNKSIKTTINKPVETLANKIGALKEQGMGYEIIEDIKKTKANISLFELCNLPQQRKKILESFNPHPTVSQKLLNLMIK